MRGGCYIYRNGNWSLLKTGDILIEDERVRLSKNSHLGILWPDGKTREINGPGVFTVCLPQIKLCIPVSCDFYNPELIIAWWEVPGTIAYRVTIRNMYNKVIWVNIVDTPYIKINFDCPKLDDETLYIVRIEDANNHSVKSEEIGLKRLNQEELVIIQNKLQNLGEILNKDAAIDIIKYAEFYEKNDLLIDALTYYL